MGTIDCSVGSFRKLNNFDTVLTLRNGRLEISSTMISERREEFLVKSREVVDKITKRN